MTSPNEVNCALLKALGINPNTVRSATITISSGQFPEVSVDYWVMDLDALSTLRSAISQFHLKPSLEP